MWYDNLENKRLWKIFGEISAIPRESGNEEGIRQYLVTWAKEHKLGVVVDKVGNVIIKCPATPGFEDRPTIALQGHMDMVCVKRAGSTHDFQKDPIDIVTDGTYVFAKDTSLGADNGIAIAMALEIFSDEKAQHGPLEGIFTVSEETGLYGAFGIDPENIESRKLLNLDSEEEDLIYIGCAGGIDIVGTKKAYWKKAEGEAFKVKVSGLLGGHSGGEIHKERANSIKVLGRFLNRLPAFNIASISGGTRRNVIPSEAEAVITVADREIAETTAKNLLEELKAEYRYSDPGINLVLETSELPEKVLTDAVSGKLADVLFTSPTGVRAMSTSLKGIVETSDNMAIVSLDNKEIQVVYSVRSSIESSKLNLTYEIQTILENYGFSVRLGEGYPAWEPNPESPFMKESVEAYRRITGREPVVTAIHAGLECGILNKAIPGMDSLSIGPNLFDVHSVNEKVEAASAERIGKFVKEMLKDIK